MTSPWPRETSLRRSSILRGASEAYISGLTFDVRGWPQASPLDGGVRHLAEKEVL